MAGVVGASIVSIITESLYDKPIVIFREYIQNAVDAMAKAPQDSQVLSAHFWFQDNNLYFLDNGTGIASSAFETTMTSIARSDKVKKENIGYKGIGRLSGLPYCSSLTFINIVDYANNVYQEYRIDGDKYNNTRSRTDFNQMSFNELMKEIGTFTEAPDFSRIKGIIGERSKLFDDRNTGFLVILEGISPVLQTTIEDPDFMQALSWLLPIPFDDEISQEEPFSSLSMEPAFGEDFSIPAKSYTIYFDNKQLKRPLKKDMLRTYLCKSNFAKYAVCVHSFSNRKIALERGNPFSGIRIYIDNMLLCDENELIPALQQYGLTNHGLYELIQSVRGIGALIYIVDKISISTNARRTFIDVTNSDAVEFLKLIGEFVENVYQARYALSNYNSAKAKDAVEAQKISTLRERAQASLEVLARDEVIIDDEQEKPADFSALSKSEKKRVIKNKISKELNAALKKYLAHTEDFCFDTCVEDFKTWFNAN